jgi:beta-N-acetylhexosaminidase
VISTFSKKVNTEIARERLGFKGIITSDAFGMLGLVHNADPVEACVNSICSGVDVILKRHGRKANFTILESLQKGIRSGFISEERVNKSLSRIFALKEKYCFSPKPDISTAIWNKNHIRKLEHMGEDSVTLLRNNENLLPLKLDYEKKVLLIMPDMLSNASLDGTFGDQAGYIVRGILSEKFSYSTDGFDLIHYELDPYEKEIENIVEKAKEYDILILGSHRANLRSKQGIMVKKLHNLNKKIIWVALNIPYDLFVYPKAKTYICTYSERLPQLKALCSIIAGEINPKGRLPVSISGLHNFGDRLNSF